MCFVTIACINTRDFPQNKTNIYSLKKKQQKNKNMMHVIRHRSASIKDIARKYNNKHTLLFLKDAHITMHKVYIVQ